MIEPSPERFLLLHQLCSRDERLSATEALVGSTEGMVSFREQQSNSGVVVEPGVDTVAMVVRPLDTLLAGTIFAHPELIKVDVQGYDLEVLKGATSTLRSVEVVVVELSLIQLHPVAPSFRDMVDWLDDRGFRILEFCGFIRRPVDDALWQIDAVFVRKGS